MQGWSPGTGPRGATSPPPGTSAAGATPPPGSRRRCGAGGAGGEGAGGWGAGGAGGRRGEGGPSVGGGGETRFYARLLDILRARGLAKPSWRPPLAHAATVRAAAPAQAPDVARLAGLY